jgi:hypothetical protein
LAFFFHSLHSLFDLSQVADHQIKFHILDISQGIDRANVGDGVIFESAQDVCDGIHLPQVTEIGRLLQRLLSDRSQVDVFHRSVREFLRTVHCGEFVESLVGNFGDAHVRLARVGMRRRQVCLGQNAKQR